MKIDNIAHVFFDLDHTLWDFDKNSALTFEKIFQLNNIDVSLDEFLEIYVPINFQYWKLYREEKIDKESLRYGRLKDAFKLLANTEEYLRTAGFDIIESGYAEDAYSWWKEYTKYDPDCIKNPKHEDIQAIQVDDGRWVSFGYAICQKK